MLWVNLLAVVGSLLFAVLVILVLYLVFLAGSCVHEEFWGSKSRDAKMKEDSRAYYKAIAGTLVGDDDGYKVQEIATDPETARRCSRFVQTHHIIVPAKSKHDLHLEISTRDRNLERGIIHVRGDTDWIIFRYRMDMKIRIAGVDKPVGPEGTRESLPGLYQSRLFRNQPYGALFAIFDPDSAEYSNVTIKLAGSKSSEVMIHGIQYNEYGFRNRVKSSRVVLTTNGLRGDPIFGLSDAERIERISSTSEGAFEVDMFTCTGTWTTPPASTP